MSDKRPGIDFSEASKRVKRVASGPGNPQAKENLIRSIVNQAAIREGKKAHDSLIKLAQESSPLSGRGTKQVGYGPGKKLGAGRWRYQNGKWIPLQ